MHANGKSVVPGPALLHFAQPHRFARVDPERGAWFHLVVRGQIHIRLLQSQHVRVERSSFPRFRHFVRVTCITQIT